MTIYIFSGQYSLIVVGAKSEVRAREIMNCSNCEVDGSYKLTDTYEDGEEFIEVQEG